MDLAALGLAEALGAAGATTAADVLAQGIGPASVPLLGPNAASGSTTGVAALLGVLSPALASPRVGAANMHGRSSQASGRPVTSVPGQAPLGASGTANGRVEAAHAVDEAPRSTAGVPVARPVTARQVRSAVRPSLAAVVRSCTVDSRYVLAEVRP